MTKFSADPLIKLPFLPTVRLLLAALFEISIICIVSFTNNEAFAGNVIVYALLALFAKTLSFTEALNVVLTSLVVTPAVPVVVIYLPLVLSFSYVFML